VGRTCQLPKRRVLAQLPGLCLIVALAAGCGGSTEVSALPEASKKVLIRRKVDVKQRVAESPATGQGSSKGRAPSR
jgi:hypothetical protein